MESSRVSAGDAAGSQSQGSQAPHLSDVNLGGNNTTSGADGEAAKSRKRDFFRFGKRAEEDKQTQAQSPIAPRPSAAELSSLGVLRPRSPLASIDSLRSPGSPGRSHPYGQPNSPRQMVRSASPRTHSPASSMIFERNVQEDVVPPEASPQIPSHILTENHIPPALDATSEAITDKRLNPDTVEIVTHATHQPAAVTITNSMADQSLGSLSYEDFAAHLRQDSDNASNYASLESGDVRRLSFISFADVVHAEHEFSDQRRDSTATGHPALGVPRSTSPMRSPMSSQVTETSPPESMSTSTHATEISPQRGTRGTGSPLSGQVSPSGGELNIETMSQALRRTGSRDAFRSAPMSAVGNDDGTFERPFR